MHYLARTADGDPLLGDDDGYVPLSAAIPGIDSVREGLSYRESFPDLSKATADRIPSGDLAFGSPLEEVGKLFGIGLTYSEHADDLNETSPDEPASFFKLSTAATGPGGPIRLPPVELSDRVTAEAELAVVGRTCRDIAIEDAADVIAGYLPVIDVTAEDILDRNPRFLTRAKSFDTFLVLGPRILIPESGIDLADIEIRTVVNDDIGARNVLENMHFSPRELVSFHSRVMTLEPGDLISTGTPGAHVIRPGDSVRTEIDRMGTVRADVVG